ncbi:electron transport complex subunit RsxB [Achromobacter sp. K91]|uniref:Electron transport complex subunit RsxB n=1 Tax=Achromobacter aegrifaciens TaxID=1287736 RepID=A0ABU2D7G7_ACHAE|nr:MULTISPECIES: electron transport complex subunit RsxB [Achromobacter]MBD9421407.1 electron transport complex subunit RsxB [Achromobacter sp. ACM04]MBD9474690.1 electron transport complex subunit RsxB [Achromobacter sp. ACM01]MDR7944039.1 electron transport complex subunit RsxB [Achromobacter aegrifaciens]RIJ02008.1 electron transport complex subunit RsxB [Achromobacter sp. K91]RSE98149.1 electron transport complex subunit RsxB [Achromobacter aegrifaciens]
MSCRSLADRIDALLPQTQCTKCGYDGCRPYADAIADGSAPINRCPPGGDDGIAALAVLLDTPILPLDATRGEPGPLLVARIDEAHCIGCTLCIQACPVDAIVGANKHMHTVLADWCTGCDLCVAPCPVDCIQMVPAGRAWNSQDAAISRQRHRSHLARTERLAADNARLMAPEAAAAPSASAPAADEARNEDRKRSAIESALARARARRNPTQS